MDNLYLLFLSLAFVAAVLLVIGLAMAWSSRWGPDARRTAERLRAISAAGEEASPPPLLRKRLLSKLPALDRVLLAIPRIHSLDRFVVQSGMSLTVASFLGIAALCALGAGTVALVLGVPIAMALAVAAAGAILWALYVEYRRLARLRAIDRQLPDALELMARAMQAGHALSSAMRFAGTEAPQPIAAEFQMTFDEINFGMPLDRALENLASRVDSRDLRFFVEAVLIQRDTGGNLAELLVSIAALVRERQKLVATVRVLSSEGRISAWILAIMPFVIAGAITVINPIYSSLLWSDPAGLRIVMFMLLLMAIGIFWMWRLVRFRI